MRKGASKQKFCKWRKERRVKGRKKEGGGEEEKIESKKRKGWVVKRRK